MNISITSFRGHHEAVADADTARLLFDKLTGRHPAPLPRALKVPDTFAELEALWTDGGGGYTALSKDKVGDMRPLKEFDPAVEDVVFLFPHMGG